MALAANLQLAEFALDELESIEARCLVWGLVDNALSRQEVQDALQRVLDFSKSQSVKLDPDCTIQTVKDLREFLVEQKMLFRVPFSFEQDTHWRTRMSEGVRLIAKLRQLFPKHGTDRWTESATLVADYRFLRRPRRYPRRDLSSDSVYTELSRTIDSPVLLEATQVWLSQMHSSAGLSRFQVQSVERLLNSLESRTCSGTLISAGTGSGKTLAFYLPALSWLASQRVQSPTTNGVRVLALYPRNELLKDQLGEVYEQCRKFDSWIARHGGRPLRLGVLFGDTPQSAKGVFAKKNWSAHSLGKRSPFFNCPTDSKHGAMLLSREDCANNIGRLVCQSCTSTVDSSTLVFTRDEIQSDPPDILFTTVEMLNRHLSNGDLKHVFGVGPTATRAPDLMLLDEVHLYSGGYGAQVAYLLRRWWSASGRKSSFVGLSATISDGRAFFAQFTGLSESIVEEVSPLEDDIVEEGAEYMLALRGDPVSQTALLSTSIQSLMIGSRLLDKANTFDKSSMPFFGWRTFAFTDQLDATNRLYYDFLDAEGRDSNGRFNLYKSPNGGLAHLRDGTLPATASARFFAGQDWSVSREIGHVLSDRLDVGRTTSLDGGVSGSSEVIVATAALEVGFDDPAVGLVIQHKAPRNIASFLQRKGRGGRTRHMRPWTIVILSDYGRDRLAYQSYDQLFDPELTTRLLPLSNRYVQRMQVVYAFLDELGDQTFRDHPPMVVWRDLAHPNVDPTLTGWTKEKFDEVKKLARDASLPLSEINWKSLRQKAISLGPKGRDSRVTFAGSNWLTKRLQHQRVISLLSETLQNPSKLERLMKRMSDRLGLSADDMSVLFWSQPRPLLLGAMPTLLRRLASSWRSHDGVSQDHKADHPLPDFIPASLFSDLSLPEMRIELSQHSRDMVDQFLPVQQGLGEFAPGKVSRRYDDPLWLGVNGSVLTNFLEDASTIKVAKVDIQDWYAVDRVRDFVLWQDNALIKYRAFRPQAAKLEQLPRPGNGIPEVSDTSNAQLTWCSFFSAPHDGLAFYPSEHIGISKLITKAVLYTHAQQSQAVVRRYAIGSKAELRLRSGLSSQRVSVDFQFNNENEPCGVGFEIDVDAMVLTLNLPSEFSEIINWDDPHRAQAARSARYNWETRQNLIFSEALPNPFLRAWVAQVYLIASLQVVATEDVALNNALNLVAQGDRMETLLSVLQTVFQVSDSETEEEGSDRLRQKLNDSLNDAAVRQAVRHVARVLVEPIDSTWNDFISLTVKSTLGAACLEAIQQACPEVDPDSLIVDIDILLEDGSLNQAPQIWISEVNPGGNGLIEGVAELLVTRPDSLFRHIEGVLGPRDFEWTNVQLRQIIQWLGGASPDDEVIQAVSQVRHSINATDASSYFSTLRSLLVTRGQSIFHGYTVALSMRLLRPAMPSELDQLIALIHKYWDELELRLGIEVDVRVICALFSSDDRIDQAFESTDHVLPMGSRTAWRFGVLMGLLWPQGHALRSVAMPWSNRFSSHSISTERLLLAQFLTPRPEAIDPIVEGWETQVRNRLLSDTRAIISIHNSQVSQLLPQVISKLITEPIQFDYLNVFAQLTEVKRRESRIELTFSVPETL